MTLKRLGPPPCRLQVASGESPDLHLRNVFKPANQTFARQHRGFRKWQELVQRRQRAVEEAAMRQQGMKK